MANELKAGDTATFAALVSAAKRAGCEVVYVPPITRDVPEHMISVNAPEGMVFRANGCVFVGGWGWSWYGRKSDGGEVFAAAIADIEDGFDPEEARS